MTAAIGHSKRTKESEGLHAAAESSLFVAESRGHREHFRVLGVGGGWGLSCYQHARMLGPPVQRQKLKRINYYILTLRFSSGYNKAIREIGRIFLYNKKPQKQR